MMNNSSTIGFAVWFVALWGLHVLAVIAFFTGLLLLIIHAVKHFSAKQMTQWGIWLLVIGTVVCLLTIGAVGRPWIGFGRHGGGMMFGPGGNWKMMDRYDRFGDEEWNDEWSDDAAASDEASSGS